MRGQDLTKFRGPPGLALKNKGAGVETELRLQHVYEPQPQITCLEPTNLKAITIFFRPASVAHRRVLFIMLKKTLDMLKDFYSAPPPSQKKERDAPRT